MEISFAGKRALVTGAGKGLGKAITCKLVTYGAEVVAVSRTQSDLDELSKWSSNIQPLCLDVGNWKQTKCALQNVGPIDLLVNNAAIGPIKNFGDLTEEDLDTPYAINTKSVVNITQEVAKGMIERGRGGSIVNVSSLSSLRAFPGVPVYASTKGALDQLTRNMAAEYGPHNIRVNSVNPTFIRTRMSEPFQDSEPAVAMLERTPLKKFCEVDDVADPILFLLSDRAALITGVTLPIDGGISICI